MSQHAKYENPGTGTCVLLMILATPMLKYLLRKESRRGVTCPALTAATKPSHAHCISFYKHICNFAVNNFLQLRCKPNKSTHFRFLGSTHTALVNNTTHRMIKYSQPLLTIKLHSDHRIMQFDSMAVIKDEPYLYAKTMTNINISSKQDVSNLVSH